MIYLEIIAHRAGPYMKDCGHPNIFFQGEQKGYSPIQSVNIFSLPHIAGFKKERADGHSTQTEEGEDGEVQPYRK